jgi:hypothetical protein
VKNMMDGTCSRLLKGETRNTCKTSIRKSHGNISYNFEQCNLEYEIIAT